MYFKFVTSMTFQIERRKFIMPEEFALRLISQVGTQLMPRTPCLVWRHMMLLHLQRGCFTTNEGWLFKAHDTLSVQLLLSK